MVCFPALRRLDAVMHRFASGGHGGRQSDRFKLMALYTIQLAELFIALVSPLKRAGGNTHSSTGRGHVASIFWQPVKKQLFPRE